MSVFFVIIQSPPRSSPTDTHFSYTTSFRSPGNHTSISARDAGEAVQQQLSENIRGRRRSREASSAILAGKLFDEAGEPLIPVHTSKPDRKCTRLISRH